MDHVSGILFQRLARETRQQIFEYIIHDALLDDTTVWDEFEGRNVEYLRDGLDRYLEERDSTIMRKQQDPYNYSENAWNEHCGIRFVASDQPSSKFVNDAPIPNALTLKHVVYQVFRMKSSELLHDFVWTLERLRLQYRSPHVLPNNYEIDFDLKQNPYHTREALYGNEGEHLVKNIQHISKAQFVEFENMLFRTSIMIYPDYPGLISFIPNPGLKGRVSSMYGDVSRAIVQNWQDVVFAEGKRREYSWYMMKFYDENMKHAKYCAQCFIEVIEETELLGELNETAT